MRAWMEIVQGLVVNVVRTVGGDLASRHVVHTSVHEGIEEACVKGAAAAVDSVGGGHKILLRLLVLFLFFFPVAVAHPGWTCLWVLVWR